jgi:D-serine deaminase-like pyridoxal phosphate-dependent protein
VIYGGAVHLSKDFILNQQNQKTFGYVALPGQSGWGKIETDTFVKDISQEHGVIKANPNLFRKLSIGDMVVVLPVHSCLTANLMEQYLTLDGQTIFTM